VEPDRNIDTYKYGLRSLVNPFEALRNGPLVYFAFQQLFE